MPSDACSTCGLPLENHDRDVLFTLPDPVLGLVDAGGLPQPVPPLPGEWGAHPCEAGDAE